MMGVLFEVNDFRELPFLERISALCLLEPKRDGFNVHEVNGRASFLELDTDDDFKKTGSDYTITTTAGMVVFSPVTEQSDVVEFMGRPVRLLIQDCLMA